MSPRARSIVIATRIFRPEAAAAAFRLGALADALAESGDKVTVVTTTAPPASTDESARKPKHRAKPPFRVSRWPVLRDKTGYVRGYAQYLSFDIPLALRLLLRPQPALVIAEPPPTTGAVVRLICRLRRVPYVYYAADVWSDASASTGAPGVVVAVLRKLEHFAMGGAARVIAVSDGVADRVKDIAKHTRVSVVTNGVDTSVFRPDDGGPGAQPTAVYAGTMSEWQGADIFVRAMPAVLGEAPNARLIFLGQGSAKESLEALATQLGVAGSVAFLGVVPPDEAADWMRGARLGLVSIKPGQGYDFAIPTKLYATAACGTSVLYCGQGPSRDIVQDNGLGTSCDWDEAAVAHAMIAALSGDAPSHADRTARASWVEMNASIAATGKRAGHIVNAICDIVDERGNH